MDPLLLTLGGGATVAAALGAWARFQHARSDRQSTRSELADIKQLAEADAVLFGEELTRLDARVAGADLDEDTRLDYQAALDSYESVLRVVDRLRSIDDVSEVVDGLAAGRYAVACVLARVEGTPLPPFKVPCFFDPRHGPASTEVLWTAPGRGTRKVPACAQDAARQSDGEKVDVKMVWVNGQEVPYWAAGGLHQPYTNGYAPRTVREATLDQRATYDQFTNSQYWGGGGFPT